MCFVKAGLAIFVLLKQIFCHYPVCYLPDSTVFALMLFGNLPLQTIRTESMTFECCDSNINNVKVVNK